MKFELISDKIDLNAQLNERIAHWLQLYGDLSFRDFSYPNTDINLDSLELEPCDLILSLMLDSGPMDLDTIFKISLSDIVDNALELVSCADITNTDIDRLKLIKGGLVEQVEKINEFMRNSK